MRNLHARVQTLARPRRGRIGVSDRWDSSGGAARDSSGGAARDDHLTHSGGASIPANSSSLCARAVADTVRSLRNTVSQWRNYLKNYNGDL